MPNHLEMPKAPPRPSFVLATLAFQGYGLVQFEEAEAVEKALALDGTNMVRAAVYVSALDRAVATAVGSDLDDQARRVVSTFFCIWRCVSCLAVISSLSLMHLNPNNS